MARYIDGKYIVSFRGEFIKHKKYTIYELNEFTIPDEDENEVLEWEVNFKEELYKQAEKSIKEILGKKEKYSVEDAVRYYQIKYMAQRIPYEYAWWYQDPCLEKIYLPWIPMFNPACIEPFDYNPETSQEKNITLVIDTVYNVELRKRYPQIEIFENRRIKEMQENWTKGDFISKSTQENEKRLLSKNEIGHSNPVIVIGYIKEHEINSMHIENHYTALHEELDYEFWYFYNHS